jgi:hypothetical protein
MDKGKRKPLGLYTPTILVATTDPSNYYNIKIDFEIRCHSVQSHPRLNLDVSVFVNRKV